MCLQEKFTPLVKQTWVVTSILIQITGHGMVVSITSSILPALLAPDSPIKINIEQASWISAILGIGCMADSIITPYILAVFGRRISTIIGLITAITGPLICYFTTNFYIFVFGRFLNGTAFGNALVGAIVIGEYTSPEYRGVFLNFKSGSIFLGNMMVHVLNHYYHWKTIMLITIIPFIVSLAMAYTWPESPFWLASKQKYEESKNCFYWLRGKSGKSTQELNAMLEDQKKHTHKKDISCLKSVILFLNKFRKNNFLKPLGVCLLAIILFEFSGRHIFPAYALQIVHEVDPDPIHGFYYTLCLDTFICVSAILSVILVKLMKRRTLLFSSGILSVVILLFVCLYYYLQSLSLISKNYDTLALLIFAAYFGVVNVGCIPLCISLMGEIFPLEHRATAISVSGFFISGFMMLTLKITPIMLTNIKLYGTYAVFGLTMSICLLLLYFVLPETKDKTLQEIENYFIDTSKKLSNVVNEEEVKLTDVNHTTRNESRVYLGIV